MNFPHLYKEVSTLGNTNTVFFKVSKQHQSEWINGIFHNSQYGIFKYEEGKLELISKGLNTTKFRKCKCKDEQTALTKIDEWMGKF